MFSQSQTADLERADMHQTLAENHLRPARPQDAPGHGR
jgi:hypothetical protein